MQGCASGKTESDAPVHDFNCNHMIYAQPAKWMLIMASLYSLHTRFLTALLFFNGKKQITAC